MQIFKPFFGPKDEWDALLRTGKPLRIKFGIDPTNADLHLGHTAPLRVLRRLQQQGHHVILIIGTATARLGDPTGRDLARTGLTEEQVGANARSYLAQIGKFIDLDKAEVQHNHMWFDRWGINEFIALMGTTTVQRLTDRDDFQNRFVAGKPVHAQEIVYPLMQAWDSVAVHADAELGGTDQLFNLMLGRDLMEKKGLKPQCYITVPLLTGLDGVKKMGKTAGNYVALDTPPAEMYAQIMSIPDESLDLWTDLLTGWETDDKPFPAMKDPDDPFVWKKALAQDIVGQHHSPEAAVNARNTWDNRFSLRKDPDVIEEVTLDEAPSNVIQLLRQLGWANSNGEARRFILPSSCVSLGERSNKVTDPNHEVTVPPEGLVVRAGNRRIARVRLKT